MKAIHPDLLAAQKDAYEPSGLTVTNLIREAESEEYGAATFEITVDLSYRVTFRAAKITPTKVGQFVTLWKRIGNGPIQPFDLEDPVDFFVVSVRCGARFGQFVFPKQVLCDRGIVSLGGKGGKRAIRVYPPWDITESRQAEQTQKWQLDYFFEIPANAIVDGTKLRKLFFH